MRLTTRIFILLLTVSGAAHSSAEQHPSELKIAVIDDVPSSRMAMQLLATAYQQLGITMNTVVAPSRRALLLADSGQIDGDLFRIDTVARDYPNLIKAPYPLLKGRLYAVFSDPSMQALPTPNNPPLMVAVRRGVIIAEVTAAELGMEPVQADDYDQIRNLLDQKRVAMALIADVEGISPLNRSDWAHFTRLPEPVVEFELFHYLNRRHQSLAPALANVLETLDSSGVKEKIRAEVIKYSGTH